MQRSLQIKWKILRLGLHIHLNGWSSYKFFSRGIYLAHDIYSEDNFAVVNANTELWCDNPILYIFILSRGLYNENFKSTINFKEYRSHLFHQHCKHGTKWSYWIFKSNLVKIKCVLEVDNFQFPSPFLSVIFKRLIIPEMLIFCSNKCFWQLNRNCVDIFTC